MPAPPEPVLRAAVRWLERLPASGPARIRSLFTTHPDYSDITPTQYDAAYAWIRDTGLLDDAHGGIPARRRVFERAVARSGGLWLRDADLLIRGPDELPDDVRRAAAALGISETEAFGEVSTAWGKVDAAERSRVGAAGEAALLGLLTASKLPQVQVEHVAAWSDGYGYDIAVRGPEHQAHVEAKSTTRRGRLALHLSRNEYETMMRDPAWVLVAVRLGEDMEPRAVATVPQEWIADNVPADRGRLGRWESCRLDVPPGIRVPGAPSLAPLLEAGAPGLLTGAVEWPG